MCNHMGSNAKNKEKPASSCEHCYEVGQENIQYADRGASIPPWTWLADLVVQGEIAAPLH